MLKKVVNYLLENETFRNADWWAIVGASAASALFLKKIMNRRDQEQLENEAGEWVNFAVYWSTLDQLYYEALIKKEIVCKYLDQPEYNYQILSLISKEKIGPILREFDNNLQIQKLKYYFTNKR